jgi:hypothetical protein
MPRSLGEIGREQAIPTACTRCAQKRALMPEAKVQVCSVPANVKLCS